MRSAEFMPLITAIRELEHHQHNLDRLLTIAIIGYWRAP